MPRDRLDDRRRLLGQLDGLKRGIDNPADGQGLDRLRQQASTRSSVAWARPSIGQRKTAHHRALRHEVAGEPESISKRWKNHNNYADHGASLGNCCCSRAACVKPAAAL